MAIVAIPIAPRPPLHPEVPSSIISFHVQLHGRIALVLFYVQGWRRVHFMISIILCGVGFGGIKANISPLGAQQVTIS